MGRDPAGQLAGEAWIRAGVAVVVIESTTTAHARMSNKLE